MPRAPAARAGPVAIGRGKDKLRQLRAAEVARADAKGVNTGGKVGHRQRRRIVHSAEGECFGPVAAEIHSPTVVKRHRQRRGVAETVEIERAPVEAEAPVDLVVGPQADRTIGILDDELPAGIGINRPVGIGQEQDTGPQQPGGRGARHGTGQSDKPVPVNAEFVSDYVDVSVDGELRIGGGIQFA